MIHLDLIGDAGLHQVELAPGDLWVLLARAQLWESRQWLSRWLWRFRLASFLSTAEGFCLCCGARISGWSRTDTLYCPSKCRQKAYRARAADKLTPFAQVVVDAREELLGMQSDLDLYRRWYRTARSAAIVPPDLLRIQHLPELPARCGRGCTRGVGCRHTDGGPCLFASTCAGAGG